MSAHERLEILIGKHGISAIKKAKVLVMGVGGVGSICAEALVRSGISDITLVDGDVVEESNINRQIPATKSTIGRPKAEIMADRLRDIYPDAKITFYHEMWHKNSEFINLYEYDYVVDAIDSFKDKIDLIEECKTKEINIISSMGAGGRLDGSKFEVTDIKKTYNDPLAKKVRSELKKRRIDKLKVVFSTELPKKAQKGPIGSAMFAVSCAGLIIAGEVVKDLLGEFNE